MVWRMAYDIVKKMLGQACGQMRVHRAGPWQCKSPSVGEEQMAQSQRASRQQATARRQRRRWRRMALLIGVPGVVAAIAAAVALTSQPRYSGFDVIGKQPAVVQVFLPG
jgi:hypothetical protein